MKSIRTELVCLKCGNIFPIYRKLNKCKKIGHIKDLWCYKCLQTTKHFEIKELSNFLFNDTEDELELYVKNLLFNQEINLNEEQVKKLIKVK